MIEFVNAHIGYTNLPLIQISHLILEAGKLYVLVGQNGSGKSTLLRTIVKQEKLLSGDIILNDSSISNIKNTEIAKHASFVQTRFPGVEYLRVSEFIAMGRTPYTNTIGRLGKNDLEIVNKAIDTLGISHIKNKFTSEISDGERQLCAIAKAIAQETSIIILDEPTAFLDYSNKKKVLSLLKGIALNLNKCVLLSSHDIELALESKSEFLIRPMNSDKLELSLASINKDELLSKAFNEDI